MSSSLAVFSSRIPLQTRSGRTRARKSYPFEDSIATAERSYSHHTVRSLHSLVGVVLRPSPRECASFVLPPAMSTIPVPAIFVATSDVRLFPTEEMLEKERVEARDKQLPPTRPILFTTVDVDEVVANHGCVGKCDFAACECLYFSGKEGGICARCTHANLYHRVKIRRIDLEAKAAADALKREKHRRHIPTQREIDEQKVSEENKAPETINTYPCDVPDCECKK
jgi:hypothetical protein